MLFKFVGDFEVEDSEDCGDSSYVQRGTELFANLECLSLL